MKTTIITPDQAKFDFIGTEIEENLKEINRRIQDGIFQINSICGDKEYFIVRLIPYEIKEESINKILEEMRLSGWDAKFSNEYHGSPFKAIKFRTDMLNPKTVNIRTYS